MSDILQGDVEVDENGKTRIVVGRHRFTVPAADMSVYKYSKRWFVINKDAIPTPVADLPPKDRPFKAYVPREILDRLDAIKSSQK